MIADNRPGAGGTIGLDAAAKAPGNGTIGHLSLEMLKSEARINMLHVPYSGAARALSSLIGGEIAIYASSTPPALPQVKAGKLKALGVTGARRISALPEVPTVAESGVQGFAAVNWIDGVGRAAGWRNRDMMSPAANNSRRKS